jgi:hypothetical protein
VLPEEQDEPCGSLGPSRADGASATPSSEEVDLLTPEGGPGPSFGFWPSSMRAPSEFPGMAITGSLVSGGE